MPHIINTKGPTHVLEKGAILTCYEQQKSYGIRRAPGTSFSYLESRALIFETRSADS